MSPKRQPPVRETSERRSRKREAKIATWLDHALKLVAEAGPEALTVSRLAAESDSALGAMYRYFPSKEHLLAAVHQRVIDLFKEHLDRTLEMADRSRSARPDLQRVAAAFLSWSSFADVAPQAHGMASHSLADPRALLGDELAVGVDAHLRPILERCADTLRQAQQGGHLSEGDVALRAHTAWAAIHGASQFRKRDRRSTSPVTTRRIEDELIRTLLVGWGASRAEADGAVAGARRIGSRLLRDVAADA